MKKYPLFFLALLLLALAACRGQPDVPTEESMDTYKISSNTVLPYDGILRIGAVNFWDDEYVDADGVTRRGPTVLLVLWREDRPDPPQRVRAHVGQAVRFDQYEIKVVEIGHGRKFPFVRVIISTNGTAP